MLTLALAVLVTTTLLGLVLPAFAHGARAIKVSTAPWWKAAVDWLNVNFFDAIEAFRTALLLNILNPTRLSSKVFPGSAP